MSQTFSTLQNDLATGRVFSSRSGLVTVLPPKGARVPIIPQPAASGPAGLQFALNAMGPAQGTQTSGTVRLGDLSGGSCKVVAAIHGLRAIADPSIKPVLWLIHDLLVAADAAPADLAALARGSHGSGNLPGGVFTLDGNPPTYGLTGNTLSVAISSGAFTLQPDGAWSLNGELTGQTNRAYHPLVTLGPTALAEIDASVPSGTAADILTAVFMRPATVHPELGLRTHFAQRLAACTADVLGTGSARFIAPEQFGRVAVTLEGPLRGTPRLMPTRDACVLMGPTRTTL